MTRNRKLYLDICDYTKTPVCNIYDNQSDITGQATDIYIQTERNGWKELSFDIPSTCMSEEGEIPNYRLDYLTAEYRIRAITDTNTDWFIISEPKITHNAFSRNVHVRAGHVSQLLKNKNLDLEMSETDGNNVGTAEALLTTILEGSSWNVGYVYPFKEDDGSAMVRSISGQAGTGALSFIEKLCDVFEAKPVYNGDTNEVSLYPMNPFAKIKPDKIIENLDGMNVFELHYDRNIHNVEKTTNTENMATRLYAYGNSGDLNGACTLQNAEHNEYTFVIDEIADEYSFTDSQDTKRFFKGNVSAGDTLIYSDMDITSDMYIWNDTKSIAYELTYEPTGAYVTLEPSVETVKNQFPYILGLKYYKDVNLMTDEQFQEIALFQRIMPQLYEESQELAKLYTDGEFELSRVGESNSGFLKLRVAEYMQDDGTKIIIDTQDDQGVIYRSDYDEAERRYFQWHVAKELKPNGDPVNGIGSVILVVHNTTPITWDKVYLKKIFDRNGNLVVDNEGNPGAFVYSTGNYPSAVTVWGDLRHYSDDRVYLFCTNSMSGSLGAKTAEDEAVIQNLSNSTSDGTEKHPTTFVINTDPRPSPTGAAYEWLYVYYEDLTRAGDLYFCWGSKGESSWHKVYVEYNFPNSAENEEYFFSLKYKTLWQRKSGEWVQFESASEQRVANMFTKVFYYCRRRDMLYHGYYEHYKYTAVNLPVGNYAIPNEFAFYWTFTTDMPVTGTLTLDTIEGRVWQDNEISHIVTSSVVPYDTVFYPSENEFASTAFSNGTIDMTTGVEEDSNTMFRSGSIKVWEGTPYLFSLPANSSVMFYDVNLNYISGLALTSGSAADGTFTTPARTKYLRIVSSSIPTGYLRVDGYDTKFYINDKPYIILDNIVPDGDLLGINTLTKKFADLADLVYGEYLIDLRTAQKEIKDRDNSLSNSLGDMLKDGRWQDSNYVSGDEKRLYDDTSYMLRQVSLPETTYGFTYLDMFGVQNEHYYETHESKWPDIDIMDAAHLVDTEINTNCWAYIDKINRCYDKEWKTTVAIDTKLTLASRHGFTDVIARIAEVAKETKAKQSQYENAIAGPVDSARLQGAINLSQNILNGGASNYYTDDNGNFVFESADGLSAMILGGRGWGIANEKAPDGTWAWRSAATGYGINADEIVTGYLSAERIEAHSITADRLMANVGQVLDIGSNKALALYATVNGSRPAGTVKTTDAQIEIKAGYEEGGQTIPAEINVQSGGAVNVEGGEVNISSNQSGTSTGALNITSTGKFTLRSNGADNINSTANGLFIDSEQGVNFGGGRFKVVANGNSSTVNMTAGYVAIGNSDNDKATIFRMDQGVGKIDLIASNQINIAANKTLQLISNGGNVIIGNGTSPFTIGADTFTVGEDEYSVSYDRAYIYNGRTNIFDMSHDGVYLGTDGINIGRTGTGYIVATPEGDVDISGTIYATSGEIGSWTIDDTLYSVDVDPVTGVGSYVYLGAVGDYRILAGTKASENDQLTTNFSLTKDGTLTTVKGNIGGWTVGSDYIGNNTYKNSSTVGMAHLSPTVANNIVFWAGGTYNGLLENEPKFWVKKDGSIRAVLGMIGGWYIGEDYIGNANTKATSTIALASYGLNSDTDKVFWAGGALEGNPKFYITKDGTMHATGAEISGNGTFSGTITGATITGGTISGTTLSGSTISGNTISGGTISGTSISGNTITGGTIDGAAITAGSISSTTITACTINTNSKFRVDGNGNTYINSLMVYGLPDNPGGYTPVDFTDTFSNAVSYASGSWSGNTFVATLAMFGKRTSKSISIAASIDASAGSVTNRTTPLSANTWDGLARITVDLTAQGVTKTSFYNDYVTINANLPYSDGYNYAASKVVNSSSSIGIVVPISDFETTTYNVTVSSDLDTTAGSRTVEVSLGGVLKRTLTYTDYRQGFNAGEGQFSKAALTLLGDVVTGTAYHTVETGGDLYYKKGSSVTAIGDVVTGTAYHTVSTGGTVYYKAGTAVTKTGTAYSIGNASGTKIGTSVTPSKKTGTNISSTPHSFTYKKIATTDVGKYFWVGNSGAQTLYSKGSTYEYYDVGASTTLYKAGSTFSYNTISTTGTVYASGGSVTPISGDGLRISTVGAVAYKAGDSVDTISGSGTRMAPVGAVAYKKGTEYSASDSPYYTKSE